MSIDKDNAEHTYQTMIYLMNEDIKAANKYLAKAMKDAKKGNFYRAIGWLRWYDRQMREVKIDMEWVQEAHAKRTK